MLPYFNPIFGATSALLNRKRDDKDDQEEYHQKLKGLFLTLAYKMALLRTHINVLIPFILLSFIRSACDQT